MVVGLVVGLSAIGCKSSAPAAIVDPTDPANVNMATVTSGPVGPPTARVLDQRDQSYPTQNGEQYPQGNDNGVNAGQQGLNEADQAPPPLPQYAQPEAVRPNTIWTPGYWSHAPSGFYWVPGAWVPPPYVGALWTPGYWGADGPRFRFHPGFWGRHVGFYGGVNYGGGYVGSGYHGGYWNGNQFDYNQAFYPVNPRIGLTYNQPWGGRNPYGQVSYNGGVGGIGILPIAAELIAMREEHEGPLRYQYDLERQAERIRGQFYEFNRGRPEAYFADDRFFDGPGDERGDDRGDFPGRGNAFGHYKEHGNPHWDGERGNPHGEGGRGNPHDR